MKNKAQTNNTNFITEPKPDASLSLSSELKNEKMEIEANASNEIFNSNTIEIITPKAPLAATGKFINIKMFCYL